MIFTYLTWITHHSLAAVGCRESRGEGSIEDGRKLAETYNRTRDAARNLHAQAGDILELTKRLEHLTKEPQLEGDLVE